MYFVPVPDPTNELVTNTQPHLLSPSAEPSCSLTAFSSVGASHEAWWENLQASSWSWSWLDDVSLPVSEDNNVAAAAAESEDETEPADSEDEAEWAAAFAAAAAELADEAKWENAAAAESDDDAGGEPDKGEIFRGPEAVPTLRGSELPLLPSDSALKAEIRHCVEAAFVARGFPKRPLPPAWAGDTDEPIWPPQSRHWERFRYIALRLFSLLDAVSV
jgi:hypothetical protein